MTADNFLERELKGISRSMERMRNLPERYRRAWWFGQYAYFRRRQRELQEMLGIAEGAEHGAEPAEPGERPDSCKTSG